MKKDMETKTLGLSAPSLLLIVSSTIDGPVYLKYLMFFLSIVLLMRAIYRYYKGADVIVKTNDQKNIG